MGVLTDLAVTHETEADDLAASESPIPRSPGIDATGINQVMPGTLERRRTS